MSPKALGSSDWLMDSTVAPPSLKRPAIAVPMVPVRDRSAVGRSSRREVSIDNREQVVRAVEYGTAGYFALELHGELSHADTIRVSLGDAWVVIDVFDH